MTNAFSLSRWAGIIVKEFIQLRRDRLTFGMIVISCLCSNGIVLLQSHLPSIFFQGDFPFGGIGVIHGHAHAGTFQGAIDQIPVYNVSVPVIERDFWIFEIEPTSHPGAAIH